MTKGRLHDWFGARLVSLGLCALLGACWGLVGGCSSDEQAADAQGTPVEDVSGDLAVDATQDTSVPGDADLGVDDVAGTDVTLDDAEDTQTPATGEVGDRTDYASASLSSGGTYSAGTSSDDPIEYYQYSSSSADVPAVKVEPGGGLVLRHSKLTKSGDTVLGMEGSGFYGYNAGVLVSSSNKQTEYSESNKSTSLTLTDCTIETTSIGSNGAFAFGQGAVVTLDHVTIKTTGDNNARGVDATYGGTVNVSNSLISTQGGSCAALATDRYNGATAPKINASNVVGTTAGTGSPGIYCTGTFVVEDSDLTATGSEAVVVEGLNSVTLTNTNVSGTKKWGVMVYQSMSGDAANGTGSFSMSGGTLTNSFADGPAFFVCDTDAIITLTGAAIVNSSDMLLVAGKASTAATYLDNVNSSWGKLGGNVVFTATDQTLEGEIIICDSSSSIELTLSNSTYVGALDTQNLSGSNKVTLDSGSTWEVTGDSYIASLTNNGGTITGSGHLFVNGEQVH